MLGFAFVSSDGGYVSDVLAPSLLTAAGIGLSFVPVTIAATAGVRGAEAGLASGLVNTFRQVGGSIGLALLATIATQHTAAVAGTASRAAALTAGFDRAFAVGAVIAAIGAVLALVLLVRGTTAHAPAAAAEQSI
jgi:hypothetical protein